MNSMDLKDIVDSGGTEIFPMLFQSEIVGYRIVLKGNIFDTESDLKNFISELNTSVDKLRTIELTQDMDGNLISDYESDFGVQLECKNITKDIKNTLKNEYTNNYFVYNKQTNSVFGVDDDIECCESTFDEPKYIEILKLVKSALSLDISKTSTGVTIWENSKLSHYIISLDGVDDEYETRKLFKEYLAELTEGKSFELVCVEDVFGGVNYTTTRELLALNTVPDELISDGVFSCERLFREENTSWKSSLREYGKLGGSPKHKIEIQWMLKNLDIDIHSFDRFNTPDKNDRFQDILDSIAMLLGVISREKLKKGVKLKKLGLKNMNVDWCYSLEEYENEIWSGGDYSILEIKRYTVKELEDEITRTKGLTTIISEIPTNMLGRLLVDYEIDLDLDYVCLIVSPKNRKTKKRKKHGIIS